MRKQTLRWYVGIACLANVGCASRPSSIAAIPPSAPIVSILEDRARATMEMRARSMVGNRLSIATRSGRVTSTISPSLAIDGMEILRVSFVPDASADVVSTAAAARVRGGEWEIAGGSTRSIAALRDALRGRDASKRGYACAELAMLVGDTLDRYVAATPLVKPKQIDESLAHATPFVRARVSAPALVDSLGVRFVQVWLNLNLEFARFRCPMDTGTSGATRMERLMRFQSAPT